MNPEHVRISTGSMALDEVIAVASGVAVELTDEALSVIERSRSIVDTAVEAGDAIYGVTTWVGHAANERLPHGALQAMQPLLVEMHVGAMGEPLPSELVRAGMVARLNGFARGGSGVSVAVAQAVETMLNNHVHPIIPRSGPVGTGDLGQLALLGRALLGRGDVVWKGEIMPATEALAGIGLTPLTLQPKDALAIISSNALTIGHGIFMWRTVGRLLMLADLVAAASMEAIGANPSFFDPVVAEARGSRGQAETSLNLREALSGSSRVDSATAVSIQDPLSFRVVPQVHGACRDVLARIGSDLFDELNAVSDNPMVDLQSERVLSNGNFHVMNVALSVESLRLALAHVGLLSERRSGHLWDTAVTSLGSEAGPGSDPTMDGPVPPFLAGLSLRYPAAARYTRLRQLAQPVTLDVPPLDLSVEDHATNATEALWVLSEMVEIVTELLVVETLLAIASLFVGVSGSLGAQTEKLVNLVNTELATLPEGTMPNKVHELVNAALAEHLDEILAG